MSLLWEPFFAALTVACIIAFVLHFERLIGLDEERMRRREELRRKERAGSAPTSV